MGAISEDSPVVRVGAIQSRTPSSLIKVVAASAIIAADSIGIARTGGSTVLMDETIFTVLASVQVARTPRSTAPAQSAAAVGSDRRSDGGRGGVHCEVGFAHGLGVPVIFTCH